MCQQKINSFIPNKTRNPLQAKQNDVILIVLKSNIGGILMSRKMNIKNSTIYGTKHRQLEFQGSISKCKSFSSVMKQFGTSQ